MGDSSIGKVFEVSIFGESHGPCVGVAVEGCPAGLRLEQDDLQAELERRIPEETAIVSARREKDQVEVLSGLYEGYTTGAPITLIVRNKDVRSSDYEKLKNLPRPGHADFTMRLKYGGFNDLRGGGMASGRMTAALVMAGAVAKALLRQFGIEVLAHTVQIHQIRIARKPTQEEIRNNRFANPIRTADLSSVDAMRSVILAAKADGDSVGGVVECSAYGVPPGLGEPFFNNLDGELARAIFSIPAVKGVEFGAGFAVSAMKGSESNDPFDTRDGRIVALTNNAGGILGGLSSGMPIVMRVAFKPPSSIAKEQLTVDLSSMEQTTLQVAGRHDPCIVPKAVPVVEAVVALVLADHLMRSGKAPRVLGTKQ